MIQFTSAAIGLLILALGPQAPAHDPGALELLEKVARAYRAMPRYADDGSITVAYRFQNQTTTKSTPKPFAIDRTERKLVLQMDKVRFVADGKRWHSVIDHRYHVAETSAEPGLENLKTNPAAAFALSGAAGMPSMALIRLLTSEDAGQSLLQGVDRLILEPDRAVNGARAKAIVLQPKRGPKVRFCIDPKRFQLVQIDLEFNPHELPPGFVMESYYWSPGKVTFDPAPDRFRFEPGPKTVEVASLAALMLPPGEDLDETTAMVGLEIPEFQLIVSSRNGATEEISKRDLRGKYVIVDCWASWYRGSERRLTELNRIVREFNASPLNSKVRIIAINLDSPQGLGLEPPVLSTEDPDTREKSDDSVITSRYQRIVNNLVLAYGAQLPNGPVGLLGYDPSGEVVKALGIDAIPTTLLIGPDGVVLEATVGVSPEEPYRKLIDLINVQLGLAGRTQH